MSMRKKSTVTILIICASAVLLSACSYSYVQGITLDEATILVGGAVEEQNFFQVKSTSYSFRSVVKESVADGWLKKVFKTSTLNVTYNAPYLISDEITAYELHYSMTVDHPYSQQDNTTRDVVVTRVGESYVLSENGSSHAYSPTSDSFIGSFINLPSLINSNNIASLTICSSFMSSINKPNYLTSFEALSSGGDNFIITFKGQSLSVNNLYAEEITLPPEIQIKSLSLTSNSKRVDSYKSDYVYQGSVDELSIEESEILGEIEVSFTYEA